MTESEILEREKYCDVYDSIHEFWVKMNKMYGKDFEALFSREWEKSYQRKDRKLDIRKWDIITKPAQRRMPVKVSCETPVGHP